MHIVVDIKQGESKPYFRFQLGNVYITKNILIIKKNGPIPVKAVETGVDPRLTGNTRITLFVHRFVLEKQKNSCLRKITELE